MKEIHGFDVEVIENEGRDKSNFGGVVIQDAVVKTLDKNPTQFKVHISVLGNITGDNYEDVKIRQSLNRSLRASESYKQLEKLGFSHIHFGKDNSVPAFTMNFKEERKFGDKETLQILYEAIPIIKEWQSKAAEEGIQFDTVNFHELQMDLQQSFESWSDLGNKLAAENIESFTYQFIHQDKVKIAEVEAELSDLNLNSSSLKCDKMEVYNECSSYSLRLSPNGEDHVFQYDEQEDHENLFQTVQLVGNLELPIETIIIKIYAPSDPEDQKYTKDELIKRDGYAEFATREVGITDLSGISSVDDVYFEY